MYWSGIRTRTRLRGASKEMQLAPFAHRQRAGLGPAAVPRARRQVGLQVVLGDPDGGRHRQGGVGQVLRGGQRAAPAAD